MFVYKTYAIYSVLLKYDTVDFSGGFLKLKQQKRFRKQQKSVQKRFV